MCLLPTLRTFSPAFGFAPLNSRRCSGSPSVSFPLLSSLRHLTLDNFSPLCLSSFPFLEPLFLLPYTGRGSWLHGCPLVSNCSAFVTASGFITPSLEMTPKPPPVPLLPSEMHSPRPTAAVPAFTAQVVPLFMTLFSSYSGFNHYIALHSSLLKYA